VHGGVDGGARGERRVMGAAWVCPVCGQDVEPGATCRNDWCRRGDRWWSEVWSVAPHVGALRVALADYKYRARRHWAEVFGRMLAEFLDARMPFFEDFDALVPVPAYLGPGARRGWDPVAELVGCAARLAGPCWPVEPAVVKRAETPPMAGLGLGRRRGCAEGRLRQALEVPQRARVDAARLIVVDDVFTEGSTMREVARVLCLAGAAEVIGVTIARQPWGPTRSTAEPGGPGRA